MAAKWAVGVAAAMLLLAGLVGVVVEHPSGGRGHVSTAGSGSGSASPGFAAGMPVAVNGAATTVPAPLTTPTSVANSIGSTTTMAPRTDSSPTSERSGPVLRTDAGPTGTTATTGTTGRTAVSTTTTVLEVPNPPTDVIAYTDRSDTSTANVSWVAPVGSAEIVSYRVSTLPSSSTVVVSSTERSVRLSGLSPTSSYRVLVTATNTTGVVSEPGSTMLVNGASPDQSTLWSQFLGDSLHSGQSVDPGPHSPGASWTWTAASGLIDFGPLVGADGDVYVVDSTGVDVVSPTTHRLLWHSTIDCCRENSAPGWVVALAPDGGFYAGDVSGNPNGVTAVAPGGAVRWHTDLDQSGSAIGVTLGDNGILYAQSDHAVWALDPATGKVIWTFNPGPGCGCEINPALSRDGSTLYVLGGPFRLYALTSAGGSVKWDYTITQSPYSVVQSPSVGPDGTIYMSWNDVPGPTNQGTDGVQAVNPDGTRKWETVFPDPHPDSGNSAVSVTATGLAIFANAAGTVTALNQTNGHVVWTHQTPGPSYDVVGAATVARDGTIYIEDQTSVFALSNTGSVIWAASENSQPGPTNWGRSLALDSSGTLYAVISTLGNPDGQLVAFE